MSSPLPLLNSLFPIERKHHRLMVFLVGGPLLPRVGTGGNVFWGLWTLKHWLRGSRRVDTTMEGVVTNLQQWVAAQQQALPQLQTMMETQQAAAAHREGAFQVQLADLSDCLSALLNIGMGATGEPCRAAEPRHRRSCIKPRAFSKWSSFDSKAASWRDWASKFEDMLDWVAHQEKAIVNDDDIAAGAQTVWKLTNKFTLHWQSLWKAKPSDIGPTISRGSGLESWRKLAGRFDPQTVGRKRTLLGRILNIGAFVQKCKSCREPLDSGRNVSDKQEDGDVCSTADATRGHYACVHAHLGS